MNRVLIRHIIFLITLALLTVTGEAWAQQTTGQFVIKTGTGENTHYLSHANNTLGDATAFSPSVLWTSNNTYTQGGANRNYYFMEGNTPHFLGAPTFEPFGELSLSSSLPLGNQLSNPESQYYFYRWDDGLGRGVQYYGVTYEWCNTNHPDGWNSNNECWEVYWVEYNASANNWKLSAESYGITTNGGRFYPVTITEHGIDTTILMVTVGEVQVPSGLQALQGFEMEFSDDPLANHQVTPTITNNEYQYTIRPAYTTYAFDGGTHNYYDAGTGLGDQGENTPGAVPYGPYSVSTYAWTLTGPGAAYLSFAETGTTYVHTSNANAPTIYYRDSNNDGHKTATLTLTVTYSNGSKQSSSATILVKTPCQNPTLLPNPVVNYVGATVSWTPTADSYKVYWQKKRTTALPWDSAMVANVTSYVITGLEYDTVYRYKVKATSCESSTEPTQTGEFSTLAEPGLMVTGAIFGGGRMADVGGKTEVVIVNCDSIGAIFGGNDIAGTVLDTIRANHTAGYAGANITLGVDASSPYGYNGTYGPTPSNGKIRVSSVYGGGNGYYAYNGSSFVPATSSYTSETVAVGACVKAMTQSHQVGDVVWTNDGTTSKTLNFPSITNTAIIATNNLVKVDSIFGGAKNAFLTANSGDGDSIVINGGTVFAVFGGNNWGGSQGYGKHHIEVNGTTTNLAANITNTATTGYGRDFGIRYLFGGGNKVTGSTTDIHIKGGQSDEVFAGGNAADVYKANVMVECSLGADAGNHLTFGNTYTNAIDPSHYITSGSPEQGTIGENTVFANYGWDGHSGIYNVRSLYGGNNMAEMQRVPNVTLTSGSVGTVYGGGNAGDMMGSSSTTINSNTVLYGTHVVLNSNQILTDYIYGGCRMSNVYNSTWVELKEGHVGTVYGGCNISGDVGSTRVYDPYPSGHTYPQSLEEQRVKGATYVQAGAGGSDTDLIVYKNLFAGGNGYYNCPAEETPYGIHYGSDTNFDDPTGQYVGLTIPTHNETNVVVTTGTTVKGNVYAGGNLAAVGFDDNTGFYRGYPELVGMASVTMTGGRVEQNVYGGGNMASIFGRNEVRVSGGSIGYNSDGVATGGALYGGNDRAGQVAEKSNRKLPTGYGYTVASDNKTSLTTEGVKTFVGVSGNPRICTVYGGGNGDYIYGEGGIPYCGETPNQPIQPFTFVDIHINGGASGGKINTVYGGGNGVTVRGGAIVFMNIMEPSTPEDYTNVDTIFGGNNKGSLEIVADIRLLHGQVGTVYGGCNQGAMMAGSNSNNSGNLKTIGGYENIGSYVRLYNTYEASDDSTHTVTAKVKDAVYGGCRMNGVTRNSLVLVDGGNFLNTPIFGGSDISGEIGGISKVAVTGGTVSNAFGGGNGDYLYYNNNVYPANDVSHEHPIALGTTQNPITAPYCAESHIDMNGGTAANLYAGGNACSSGATLTQMTGGTVTTGLYGGCNAKGNIVNDVVVRITGGTVGVENTTNNIVFGGGYGELTTTTGNVTVTVDTTISTTPILYGHIYGGSALGSVNAANGSDTTTVNILGGNLHGDIYGGGLGEAGAENVAKGQVNGKVYVNIGNATRGYASINGDVYGCNNLNGSPQDSVFVNIYKTKHTIDDTYPTPVAPIADTIAWLNALGYTDPNFAIHAVYGGGNKAAYTPPLASNKPRCATVHVYGCRENTVKYVYGGGNAADVGTTGNSGIAANTRVIIDGGRIYQMFGGGNGYSSTGNHTNPSLPNYNPGANIYGTARSEIYAGLINEVFGGANQCGSIDVIDLNVDSNNCEDQVYGKVFGCANEAPINHSVSTTIWCDVGTIGQLYGGSNLASIGNSEGNNTDADVTLNIYGGTFESVFAGSKGYDAEGTVNDISANIYGDVTLNLYGGTIVKAFGGSDVLGNVLGTITVNVDSINSPCPLILDTVFGSGNLTYYQPYTTSSGDLITSPIVNVKNGTVRQAVFGSGKGATAIVTANPQVNIGDTDNDVNRVAQVGYLVGTTVHGGDVYGGGFEGVVHGGPVVNIQKDNTLVYHQVFGGGNKAGADSTVVNILDGMVAHSVYGGCNVEGTVTGDIEVNVLNNLGAGGTDAYDVNVFGGGLGQSTTTEGNVTVNFGDANNAPVHYGDIYGGSALGQVNAADKQTTVNFAKGTLTGNIYGGGLGQASPEIAAEVNGNVVVNIGKDKSGTTVNGGTIIGSVFGANNIKGTPEGSVTVNVFSATTDSIFGGGNQADYVPTTATINYPEINISGGNITHKVVGGGNAAGITANPHINITGGKICTVPTGLDAGIYGGCNTRGTVTGNIVVDISSPQPTGPNAADTTVIGSMAAIEHAYNNHHTTLSVHGGGYGSGTSTTGDVTVNFGFDNGTAGQENRYPRLYGDLYGGSALGSVNDNVGNDTTMVNVFNGSFKFKRVSHEQWGGNIFGGGLGQEGSANVAKGQVNGVVQVNIGGGTAAQPLGKAYLKGCNVFGCNNTNGSPQKDVYVDVYQTAHDLSGIDSVTFETPHEYEWYNYAIRDVYGGGNKAHYKPTGNSPLYEKKVHNTIHYCENTVEYVYGGGNAADTDGTVVTVDGGRFKYIFGGGNGQHAAANILGGGVDIIIFTGRVGWYFYGCNLHGEVGGTTHESYGCDNLSVGDCPCTDTLIVENYYFGANEALTVNGLNHTINCGDKMDFKNVYAGSRLAVVYGDIKLTVRGGNIQNLFGGNEGSDHVKADVRRYPVSYADIANHPHDFQSALYEFFDNHAHDDLYGKGGNIQLVLEGGKLGNVYGGNSTWGNVEGDITVIVDSTQDDPCKLDIDYLYGGNRLANYTPDTLTDGTAVLTDRVSPKVYLKNGHVNYDVFGGSRGGTPVVAGVAGNVVSNPLVVVGDPEHESNKFRVGRDIYGGGSMASMKGNTLVVLQGKATIGGDVYGGAKVGDVEGSTDVRIAPSTPVPVPETPTPAYVLTIIQPDAGGSIAVYYDSEHTRPVSSGTAIVQNTDLFIVATAATGYTFDRWHTIPTNPTQGGVQVPGDDTTTFIMCPHNTTLTATFTP